jgi:hypothetical protein
MKAAGVPHPNRPRKDLKGRKTPSYFAEKWRDYASNKID